MVAESTLVRIVIPSIDLGSGTTVAVGRPGNKQNQCRTGKELRSSVEKKFAISCFATMSKRIGKFLVLQTQNLSYTHTTN